jgi:hypothetical protein
VSWCAIGAQGIVLDKEISHPQMKKEIKDAKVSSYHLLLWVWRGAHFGVV